MSNFSEFQRSEYEHIAEAHFKAIEAISTFFRYYLVVMSIPLPVLAVMLRFGGSGADFSPPVGTLLGMAWPFLIATGIVGFCMMMYIINIKMDVTLYSRVVNSIRKYFYDLYPADHANKLLMRQLPQSANFPRYLDIPFIFVILAFSIFDVLYFGLGAHIFAASNLRGAVYLSDFSFDNIDKLESIILIATVLVFFSAHFISYYAFAAHRESFYLRGRALGVDIDGVLNKHREMFCEMAASKLGKSISPDEIKVLPVHDNTGLSPSISRNDERQIFNDPTYWVDMPALEGAAEAIRSIRNSFLLPVHVFTHRPWPDALAQNSDSGAEATTFRRTWRLAANEMARRASAKPCARIWVFVVTFLNYRASIRYITKYWLHKSDVMFDTLLVESGNENRMYSRGRRNNRFNYSNKRKIRFFVEDDWVNAVRLSYICDIVFLIDQPYNKASLKDHTKHDNDIIVGTLPSNIIRVTSWDELKRTIGQFV